MGSAPLRFAEDFFKSSREEVRFGGAERKTGCSSYSISYFVLYIVYERSEFCIVIGAGIVEEIEVKAEYMDGLADRILRCR